MGAGGVGMGGRGSGGEMLSLLYASLDFSGAAKATPQLGKIGTHAIYGKKDVWKQIQPRHFKLKLSIRFFSWSQNWWSKAGNPQKQTHQPHKRTDSCHAWFLHKVLKHYCSKVTYLETHIRAAVWKRELLVSTSQHCSLSYLPNTTNSNIHILDSVMIWVILFLPNTRKSNIHILVSVTIWVSFR